MYSKKGVLTAGVVLLLAAALLAGCKGGDKEVNAPQTPAPDAANVSQGNNGANGADADTDNDADAGNNAGDGNSSGTSDGQAEAADQGNAADGNPSTSEDSGSKNDTSGDKAAAADPFSIAVLINKQFALPEDYEPTDLVYPDVHFTFKEKIEKRMMRKEAAAALEELFAGAEKDGVYLAGVSAYRSHSTQTALFNRYVEKDGEEKAKTYSAVPGHSEHETGLAIDVSGSDGKCAAESCFGDTKEADWLAEHAAEYGFIIRYPEGKEDITGYKYEPWHLRYVGKEISADIAERGITLEEYYDAVPVSGH